MPTPARLFSAVDVVAVTTGVLIDLARRSSVNELVRFVSGKAAMPKKGSEARDAVVTAVRMQLPSALRQFDQFELIGLIMDLKTTCRGEDNLRSALCSALEARFGRQLPLVPREAYLQKSDSLALLCAIADNPTSISHVRPSVGHDQLPS